MDSNFAVLTGQHKDGDSIQLQQSANACKLNQIRAKLRYSVLTNQPIKFNHLVVLTNAVKPLLSFPRTNKFNHVVH